MRDELEPLRTSLRRIAEATRDAEIIAAIPPGDVFAGVPYAERGWNRLAAMLVDWVQRQRDIDKEVYARVENWRSSVE